jgi:hypothetical protein
LRVFERQSGRCVVQFLSLALALMAVAISGEQASSAADPASSLPSQALKASATAVLGEKSPAAPPDSAEPPRNPRVLFITAKDSTRCIEELARLRRPGGDFERMRAYGWKIGPGAGSHLQIVDRDSIPDLVRRLDVHDYPTVACVSNDEIVRSFQSGCTTPLDQWTFGWLAKGIDERPASSVPEAARAETTGHYPLRGNHWSVDGDWSPARETMIHHLRGPNHASRLSASWEIESWSYEELRSLHDNLHEAEGGVASSSSRAKSGNRGTNQFSANRKITGR